MDISALPYTIDLRRDENATDILLSYVDQTRLPDELSIIETDDWMVVVHAIKQLEVRGAPAIGLAGAAAYVLAANSSTSDDIEEVMESLSKIAGTIIDARPTAVNLAWAVKRIEATAQEVASRVESKRSLVDALYDEVKRMEQEDEAANRAIGVFGSRLLPAHSKILTHCNAGSLATRFYGTALGVIYSAASEGKVDQVFVDETRPVGQGARLTAWELSRVGIPATLICDNMAASLMAKGEIDAVIVGADRICANGDVVNKIGTYGLAVLAQYHCVPLYVAAPLSTFDLDLASGSQVVIEQRDTSEVMYRPPSGVAVYNPAFDMTPSSLVSAVITEQGVFSVHDGSWDGLIR